MAKRGKKSYTERQIIHKEAEIFDLRMIISNIRDIHRQAKLLLESYELTCKQIDNFAGEYSKETAFIRKRAKSRMYFGRHFYPELMVTELTYMAGEISRVLTIHERHLEEYKQSIEEEEQ